MYRIALILLISIAFCGKPLDITEKGLFALYTSLQIADVYTTNKVLSQGGFELNPLYGKNSSLPKLILIKSAGTILSYYLIKKLDSRVNRKILLTVLDFAYLSLVCRNYRQL